MNRNPSLQARRGEPWPRAFSPPSRCSRGTGSVCRRNGLGCGCASPTAPQPRCTGRPASAAAWAKDPCTLVVTFRLRLVHGPAHALFRTESLLNTPLFVGFPGFTSKLWLAHDERDRYRGVYEWDGPERAEHYARSLWRVLALVSVPGSIRYAVLPGLRRDDILANPGLADGPASDDDAAWWRIQGTA